MIRFISVVLATFFLVTQLANAAEPIRAKGISVHALPKRVAKIGGTPWGLEVSYAPYLKPEPGIPYLQSIEDVLQYIEKQDPSVIENGLWVVTSHPSAYDAEEKAFHELVKETLPKEGIPLFWVRGSEIENGFARY